MPYQSLREFMTRLEREGRLVRVGAPVSPHLEMTEIQTRVLAEGGPALLFENWGSSSVGAASTFGNWLPEVSQSSPRSSLRNLG